MPTPGVNHGENGLDRGEVEPPAHGFSGSCRAEQLRIQVDFNNFFGQYLIRVLGEVLARRLWRSVLCAKVEVNCLYSRERSVALNLRSRWKVLTL